MVNEITLIMVIVQCNVRVILKNFIHSVHNFNEFHKLIIYSLKYIK